MTTIAVKNGVIAADSQCTTSFTRFDSVKLKRITSGPYAGYVFGGAGSVATLSVMLAQVTAGELSPISTDDEGSSTAIVVSAQRGYRLESGSMIPSRFRGCYAVGSGCDFAMGSMLAGVSAVEAVRIATKLDLGTGGPVRSIEL